MSDTRQTHHTAAERAQAFQLWAFECGRSASKVATALEIPYRTVARWSVADDWPGQADALLASIMPDLVRQSADNLRLAAFHVSRRLLAIARAADVDDTKPDVREVDALTRMLDRGGFSPVGSHPLESPERDRGRGALPAGSIEDIIAAHHRALGLDVPDSAPVP